MTRIDLTTLTSNAIAKYEAQRDDLQAAVDDFAAKAREWAKGQTRPQLIEALQKFDVDAPSGASKSDLVEKYAEAYTAGRGFAVELRTLKTQADADRTMAEKLNDALDARNKAQKDAVAIAGNSDILTLQRWADDAAVTAEVGRIAADIVKKVVAKTGDDIRAIVRVAVCDAMYTLAAFPRHTLSNGLSGAGRAEHLYVAIAAERFLRMVRRAYQDAGLSFDVTEMLTY